MDIKGKRFVLTGASGGIGQELAKQLSYQGASLVLVGRNAIALNQLAAELPDTIVIRADLGCELDFDYLVNQLKRMALDGVIQAAGLNAFATLDRLNKNALDTMIQTNLLAPMQLTQALLPQLLARPSAVLLNVGSTLGSIGYAGYSAYCACKFGLRGFCESMRRELASTDGRVLYVAPRATATEMNSDAVTKMNRQLGVAMDSPKFVAAQIVRAIEQESAVTYLGWPEKLFARINGVAPGLVDKSLAKQLPTIQTYAKQQHSAL